MHAAPTAEERLALAQRYVELGLPAAAAGALDELLTEPDVAVDVAAAAHAELARLRSAAGASQEALQRAERALALRDDPAHRLLVVELALAAGLPARASSVLAGLGVELEAPERARRQLAQAALHLAERAPGEAALALVALLDELDALPAERLEEVVALARGAAAVTSLRDRLRDHGAASARLLDALLLEAAGGSDDEIEATLGAALDHPPARLALALRLARRRARDPVAREGALGHLEALLAAPLPGQLRARVLLLLASLHDDDLGAAQRAAEGYLLALPQLPRDGTACNNLGVIALRGDDLERAEHWFVAALVADPQHETAQRNLARILHAATSPQQLEAALARLRAAGLEWRTLAHLCFALVEVARDDAQQGIAAKGHQLKNLLGVLGARLRGLARRSTGEVRSQLQGLSERLASAFDEWAAYLRTIREEVAAYDVIDLNALAAEAARQVGGRVRLRLADDLPEVHGLRGHLSEALINLLRNGAEACGGDESRELSLRTEVASDGRTVSISVIDGGPGIAPGELRRVLQAGYTTKRDGSGLGLSLCQRVAQGHGGRLEIASTPGVGTTVRLLLPVHLESQTRHGMLQTPLARVLRAAAAEEYVIDD